MGLGCRVQGFKFRGLGCRAWAFGFICAAMMINMIGISIRIMMVILRIFMIMIRIMIRINCEMPRFKVCEAFDKADGVTVDAKTARMALIYQIPTTPEK